MINLFSKMIVPEHILEMQNLQYAEKLLLEDTVPASSEKPGSVNISSLGHFYCIYITGHYTTLYDSGDTTIEDGQKNYLRGQLVDGSNNRQLFNDYVPLDLFCTPGRIKSPLSTGFQTDPQGHALFYPQVFQYMFTVNSQIVFKVKNDSNYSNTYALCFHGIRLPVAQQKGRIELAKRIKAKFDTKKPIARKA